MQEPLQTKYLLHYKMQDKYYGGLDVEDILDRKGLTVRQKILDYMGSTELTANSFRISQTEGKWYLRKLIGIDRVNYMYYAIYSIKERRFV